MTLSVLKGHSLLQAFSSAMFRICGKSRSPSVCITIQVYIVNRHDTGYIRYAYH